LSGKRKEKEKSAHGPRRGRIGRLTVGHNMNLTQLNSAEPVNRENLLERVLWRGVGGYCQMAMSLGVTSEASWDGSHERRNRQEIRTWARKQRIRHQTTTGEDSTLRRLSELQSGNQVQGCSCWLLRSVSV
jgi:hypothetical protein